MLKSFVGAIRQEKSEAANLVKAFSAHDSSEEILEILARVALIDRNMNEVEEEFIGAFSVAWKIKFDADKLREVCPR